MQPFLRKYDNHQTFEEVSCSPEGGQFLPALRSQSWNPQHHPRDSSAAYKRQAESTYTQSKHGSCQNPRESSGAHEISGEHNNQSECRSPCESSGESSYSRPRSRPCSTINQKVRQIVTPCGKPAANQNSDRPVTPKHCDPLGTLYTCSLQSKFILRQAK